MLLGLMVLGDKRKYLKGVKMKIVLIKKDVYVLCWTVLHQLDRRWSHLRGGTLNEESASIDRVEGAPLRLFFSLGINRGGLSPS